MFRASAMATPRHAQQTGFVWIEMFMMPFLSAQESMGRRRAVCVSHTLTDVCPAAQTGAPASRILLTCPFCLSLTSAFMFQRNAFVAVLVEAPRFALPSLRRCPCEGKAAIHDHLWRRRRMQHRRRGVASRVLVGAHLRSKLSVDALGPCDRSNLSKRFLAGAAAAELDPLRPPAFNREHGIEPKLDAPVAPLDTQGELADDGAPSLHYRADR